MFEKVKPYMGNYMLYTKKAVACIAFATLCSVVPYFLLYGMIHQLVTEGTLLWSNVLLLITGTALCLILNAVLYVKGLSYSHYSAYHTLENIRISLQQRLEKQPLGNIRNLGNGRIKNVFTDDIDNIELLLAHAIPEGLANLLIPIVVLISMFFIDWKLACLCILTLPIGILAMGVMFKVGMGKMDGYYAAGARMNNTIIEYVNGMEVVKVFNKDGESYKRFENDVKSYRDLTLDWYKVCWPWMALYSSIIPCVALFALPIGAWFVLMGWSTLSDLILVVCMSFAVGTPLLKAMSFAGKFPQLNYKIDELEKLIKDEPLKQKNKSFQGKNHSVSLSNVHFAYEEQEVIHGINLEIEEKKVTALVGASGSGKSTLAKLLVHFYDLNEGSIKIGGQDITDMNVETLNEQIAYVSQEQFLFNTSLYENIHIGRPEASRKEILQAAKRAQCDEFLRKLPNGIDTLAGDSGKMLSGGERQRISLARALLKNAPIIVLDEATAFIDPENEEKMNEAISEIIEGKTVLIIAHRLNTIKEADKICVLRQGQIIAEGTHDSLLEECEEYKVLWKNSEDSAAWEVKA